MKVEKDKSNTPLASGKSYWLKWYIAVLVFLLIQITAYYLITKHFK